MGPKIASGVIDYLISYVDMPSMKLLLQDVNFPKNDLIEIRDAMLKFLEEDKFKNRYSKELTLKAIHIGIYFAKISEFDTYFSEWMKLMNRNTPDKALGLTKIEKKHEQKLKSFINDYKKVITNDNKIIKEDKIEEKMEIKKEDKIEKKNRN